MWELFNVVHSRPKNEPGPLVAVLPPVDVVVLQKIHNYIPVRILLVGLGDLFNVNLMLARLHFVYWHLELALKEPLVYLRRGDYNFEVLIPPTDIR